MKEKRETLIDVYFKDASPIDTVNRIKKILKENEIEIEEIWNDSGVPNCLSLSLYVIGTKLSVMGKGLTKEFARASAYGELMERLQMGFVNTGDAQKDSSLAADISEEVIMSAREMYDEHPEWYMELSSCLKKYIDVDKKPEDILMQFANEDGKIVAIQYYNASKQREEYYSKALHKRLNGANGCAAGNSMEEAVVQALSELVERNHHIRTIAEEIVLPDIPETELKNYKKAYSIIEFLREQGYTVIVKDCSFGMRFPVVNVSLINTETGKYHTHFGAAPIFEIALERTLTETFQGRKLDNIAFIDDFSYSRSKREFINAMTHEIIYGIWKKPATFFTGTPTYEYNANMGFNGTNNRELFKECINYFKELGLDVLIRDCSSLGFPTYQVIIPGYSYVYLHRLDNNYFEFTHLSYASRALRNPSSVNLDDYVGTMIHINNMKKLDKSLFNYHGFASGAKLNLNLNAEEDSWLLIATLAYISYEMGQYNMSISYIETMIPFLEKKDKDSAEYLSALKKYLSLVDKGYKYSDIEIILKMFHKKATIEEIVELVKKGENPLEKYTLHCTMKCSKDCILYTRCYQKRVEELTKLIGEKGKNIDFNSFIKEVRSKLN